MRLVSSPQILILQSMNNAENNDSSNEPRKYRLSYSPDGVGKDIIQSSFSYGLRRVAMTLDELIDWQTVSGGGVVASQLIDPILGRKLWNFAGHEVLFVDIDGNWTIKEFLRRFSKRISAIYTSSSHGTTKKGAAYTDRFRAVLILPFAHTSLAVAMLLQRAANVVFESDPAVRSPNHIIYGTTNPEVVKTFTNDGVPLLLDIDWLLNEYSKAVGPVQVESDIRQITMKTLEVYREFLAKTNDTDSELTKVFRSERKAEIAQLEQGLLGQILLDCAAKKEVRLHIQLPVFDLDNLRAPNPKSCPKSEKIEDAEELDFESKAERNVDLQLLKRDCKLLRKIHDATHTEMMHLIWNLRHIVGGLKFLAELTRKGGLEKTWRRFLEYKNYAASQRYAPSSCAGRCRYHGTEQCSSPHSIVALIKKKGSVQISEPHGIYRDTLDKARCAFQVQMRQLLNERPEGITLVNAVTGIGKTTVIRDFITQDLDPSRIRTVIASPTHAVIGEYPLGARFQELSESLKKKFEPFYDSGILPDRYVKSSELTEKEKEEIKTRKAERIELLNEDLLHVTHSRLVRDSKLRDPDLLIIDEDFMNHLLPQGHTTKSGLRRAISLFRDDMRTANIAKTLIGILEATPGSVHEMPFSFEEYHYKAQFELLAQTIRLSRGDTILGNIPSLLQASHFLWSGEHLYWIEKRRIPAARTTIITSATARADLLELALPQQKIEVRMGPLIRPMGNLIQFTGASFSSGSIHSNKERRDQFDTIVNYCEENQIACITYPSGNVSEAPLHLFDAQGRNEYAGKDLVVIGTPNPPDHYVRLAAVALGLPTSQIRSYADLFAQGGSTPRVEYEAMGYRLNFNYPALSDHPDTWAIQQHFTYSILMQAVGRARYYEHPCNVYLFSSFPLPDFTYNSTPIREIVANLSRFMRKSQ